MGNTTSDVNDSLKAQAGGEGGPEIYKLINVSGGGELVKLMKQAIQTKDYTDLDNFIETTVKDYLYNEGRGEQIPIEKIVLKRTGGKIPMQIGVSKNIQTKKENETKELCFKMDKTGAVGESLLHLCMLNGTALHHKLAKRLLKHFPKQVNDIYLCDDYYGEGALHMAIVSEDPSMVKFLLVNGADVHLRCCGKFFCPEDQKLTKADSLQTEYPILPTKTSYAGYSYFGEYALSFAAILNQEECIRLLIAKGADPNRQDSNGNTVLHMLVINNNMEMFKLMLEFNASLNIKNRQGLTPLTLAAKLARKEMFDFIMERMRNNMWIYADISCAAYPLETVDTIGEGGITDTNSALHLITNGESEEHLELLEGLVVDLLNRKWNTYISSKFYAEVILFFIYFILSGISLLMKRLYFDTLSNSHCTEIDAEYTKLESACYCCYLNPNDDSKYPRIVLDIILWLYSTAFLIITVSEFYVQGFYLYMQTLLFNPSKVFFIISLIATLLIIPMRFSCNAIGEDYLTVISIILKSTYILYLGRGFKRITTFVYIIHKVISTNLVRFFAIFFIFMMGFSQAFYIIYGFGKPPVTEVFTSPFQSAFDVLVMSVHDFLVPYKMMLKLQTGYAVLGRFWLVFFIILATLLLVNMLIAMMASTYDETTELKREWLRQWAKQVLTIEQNMTRKDRLKQQKKYAYKLPNEEIAFIVRWKQSKEEREEIKSHRHVFQEQLLNAQEEALKSI